MGVCQQQHPSIHPSSIHPSIHPPNLVWLFLPSSTPVLCVCSFFLQSQFSESCGFSLVLVGLDIYLIPSCDSFLRLDRYISHIHTYISIFPTSIQLLLFFSTKSITRRRQQAGLRKPLAPYRQVAGCPRFPPSTPTSKSPPPEPTTTT